MAASRETVAEKHQQLVRGSEAKLARRIDFFDTTGEMTLRWIGIGRELDDERPPHDSFTL
jgi:hypothetical protein